jgi:hypothetical protein
MKKKQTQKSAKETPAQQLPAKRWAQLLNIA